MPIRPAEILPGTKFVLLDPQTKHHYPLQTGLNTIGRYPDNDIVLDPISVSRRHCVLLVHTGGRCELHDTASLNGTFVNDHRIQQPVRLDSGDRLKIGPVQLFFVREEDCPSGDPNPDYPGTAVLE
jgi:pSer/pThr/pTyr-binding forkhead associated (FHA) protein